MVVGASADLGWFQRMAVPALAAALDRAPVSFGIRSADAMDEALRCRLDHGTQVLGVPGPGVSRLYFVPMKRCTCAPSVSLSIAGSLSIGRYRGCDEGDAVRVTRTQDSAAGGHRIERHEKGRDLARNMDRHRPTC